MVNPSETHPSCPARVLEAALELFSEAGYRASIDAVAKRAGVARQTIYNNFENKDALFLAALEQAVGDLFAVLEDGEGDWYSRLVQFSLSFRAKALSPAAIGLHRVLVAEAPRFPVLADAFYQRVILMSRQRLARLFEIGIQEGCLRNEDPQEAAYFFIELLLGSDHTAMLFTGEKVDPSLKKQKVQRAIELFARAFANPDYCVRKDVP